MWPFLVKIATFMTLQIHSNQNKNKMPQIKVGWIYILVNLSQICFLTCPVLQSFQWTQIFIDISWKVFLWCLNSYLLSINEAKKCWQLKSLSLYFISRYFLMVSSLQMKVVCCLRGLIMTHEGWWWGDISQCGVSCQPQNTCNWSRDGAPRGKSWYRNQGIVVCFWACQL